MVAKRGNQRHPCRVVGSLILLLVLPPANGATAQFTTERLDIRIGQGHTMTSPAARSFLFSVPTRRLVTRFLSLYVDESIMILDERGTLDFIVGIDPRIQVNFPTVSPGMFVEAGVGVNLATFTEKGKRQLGSVFLFSPTASVGLNATKLLTILYTFKHLSNASLFQHNDGINFQYIVFQVGLRHF